MTTNTFTWLHLTDFHFGLDNQHTLWANLLQPFLNDLATLHAKTGPWQVVFFTGDLVQQGKSEEFHAMQKEVLDKLWEKLTALGSGDAVLLAVAGNHDLFRPNPNEVNPAMDGLLNTDGFQRIADKFWNNPADAYCRASNDTFAAYTEWWQTTPHRPKDITKGILAGDFAHTLQCGDKNIGIVGLNTAFLQLQGGDYKGKLAWDARQLNAVCSNDINAWLNRHDLCLLLTHQGQDWLTPEAKKHGETEIAPAGRFALHLFGHQHEADYQCLRVGGSSKAIRRLQACSVFGMEKFGEPPATLRSHGYAVGQIKFNKANATLKIYPRIATDKPQGTGWKFIPDRNIVLEGNGISTKSEKLLLRVQKTSPSIPVNNDTKSTASPAAPHSTLPSRRPFFGRVTELANIATYLQPDHTGWGVVLDGVGGIGKTSLAIEAAHAAPAERFPLKLFITAKKSRLDVDGEHKLPEGRVNDYFNLLTEISTALGCEQAQRVPLEQQAKEVHHALSAQRVLLVLDNLEALSSEERRRLYDLLERLPATCRAIVTTRRRDETTARVIRLDKLNFAEAKQLLAALRERNTFLPELTEDDQQLLYAQTGGNPLLLTWTAGQLGRLQGRCRTVDEAIERLIEAHEKNNDPLEFVFGDLLDTFT
ncbi:MAG: metallophosphoesterase, partial [Methylococcaceae bacterium]